MPHGARTSELSATMSAVVTTGTGGPERLEYREVPLPTIGPGEVLIEVLAAGLNNTDVNTRIGWYASSVRGGTDESAPLVDGTAGGYSGASPFPLIQGADCCGRVATVGPGVTHLREGQRVLVRSCMTGTGPGEPVRWLGSDVDGAFAEFVAVPAVEAYAVSSSWSDAELATIPCSFGTAENMVRRSGLGAGDRVLVTGASGGVGSALVQLASRRGAEIVAVARSSAHDVLVSLGAHRVVDRGVPIEDAVEGGEIDVVFDNVAGPAFGRVLRSLRAGGSYVTSGAIAGPVVDLDLRTLYLNDLRLVGTTTWSAGVFDDLVGYVERDEIRPLLARTFALADIRRAQDAFQQRRETGGIVVVPTPGTGPRPDGSRS